MTDSQKKQQRKSKRQKTAQKVTEPARTPRQFLLACVLVVLGLVSVCSIIAITGIGLVDDAYIALRYSRNFSRGMGLVYNLGERVDGYTSFLWTFGIGCLAWLGASPVWTAGFFGAFFAVATALCLIYRYPWKSDSRYLSALALAFSPCFVFWSGSGLETALFAFLLTCSVLRFIVECNRIEARQDTSAFLPNGVVSGLCLALAALTRQEAVLALVVNCLMMAIVPRHSRARAWRLAAWHLLSFSVVFGTWVAWHWNYYGHPLPNTYYCKVWGGGYELWLRGIRHVTEFSIATVGLPLFVVASALFAKDWRERYLAVTALALIGGVIRVGGDHFALYRFLVPVLPLVALLVPRWFQRLPETKVPSASKSVTSRKSSDPVAEQPTSLHQLLRQQRSTAALVLYLTLSGAVCLFSFDNHRSARLILEGTRGWAKVGKWFAWHTTPNESIATQAIGAIGYYSDRPIVDILGLVDSQIAHLPIRVGRGFPGHEKHDAAYTLSRNPDFIVLGHSGRVPFKRDRKTALDIVFQGGDFLKGEQDILTSPGFEERYEFESIALSDGTFIECFTRKRD